MPELDKHKMQRLERHLRDAEDELTKAKRKTEGEGLRYVKRALDEVERAQRIVKYGY